MKLYTYFRSSAAFRARAVRRRAARRKSVILSPVDPYTDGVK